MCVFPIYKNFIYDENGKMKIDWSSSGVRFGNNPCVVRLRCGKCSECMRQRASEWALRIMQESSLYTDNCMITLTYRDTDGELVKSDIQKFVKRLRKKLAPKQIRVFYCGEYGAKGGRPHFHIILFNYKPQDLVFFFSEDGHNVYKSYFLEQTWGLGYVSVVDLTFHTAFYCSLYMQKYNNVANKVQKPFLGMSNRPGIGFEFAKKVDYTSDTIYFNGKSYKVPRYYDKLNFRDNPVLENNVKRNRLFQIMLKELPLTEQFKIQYLKREQEAVFEKYQLY